MELSARERRCYIELGDLSSQRRLCIDIAAVNDVTKEKLHQSDSAFAAHTHGSLGRDRLCVTRVAVTSKECMLAGSVVQRREESRDGERTNTEWAWPGGTELLSVKVNLGVTAVRKREREWRWCHFLVLSARRRYAPVSSFPEFLPHRVHTGAGKCLISCSYCHSSCDFSRFKFSKLADYSVGHARD